MIKECHKTVYHNDILEGLASLQGKKIIRKCVYVNDIKERPTYTRPLIPDLPAEQLSADPPFNNMGVDFAGPLFMHTTKAKENKAYICILMCASIRASHMEVMEGLSANTFLPALRHFCGKRGIPSIILSDNVRMFKHCAIRRSQR